MARRSVGAAAERLASPSRSAGSWPLLARLWRRGWASGRAPTSPTSNPPIGLDAQPIARNTPGHGINPRAKEGATRKDTQGQEARCT